MRTVTNIVIERHVFAAGLQLESIFNHLLVETIEVLVWDCIFDDD